MRGLAEVLNLRDSAGHPVRVANLRDAAQRKRRDAEARAAIKAAGKSGHPSTFRGIAEAAGVSPSFLYSHPEFRDQILRMRSANTPTRRRAPQTGNEVTLTALLESALREKKQLLELNERLTPARCRPRGAPGTPLSHRHHQTAVFDGHRQAAAASS